MIIPVKTSTGSYDIITEYNALDNLQKYLTVGQKTLVVTDSGVPGEYYSKVANYCKNSEVIVIPQGEKNKSAEQLKSVIDRLVEGRYTRSDRVIAVGGGVIGDLAGFAASVYMRGIEFINIPTTLLSQVDSSVGGKTAIDYGGVKNIIGSFYPPGKVIIDHSTLQTLPKRHIANGLAEALKMALCFDKELFGIFENGDIYDNLGEICERSVMIKRDVVQKDEKESGLRRVLNFGHTVGHAVESARGMELLHGECVAAGMVPMCGENVKRRLIPVLQKLGLPCVIKADAEKVIENCLHDKKFAGDRIITVYCEEIGSFEFRSITAEELIGLIKQAVE